MDKIFVIAGHNTASQGAVGYDGVTEHTRTVALQNAITKELREKAVEVITDKPETNLIEVIDLLNITMSDRDTAIDIHFNDNNPRATGTEVYIHQFSENYFRDVATRVVRAVSEAIDIPIRRYVRSRDYKYPHESNRGTLGIIDKVKVDDKPACVMLVEVCFLNEKDLRDYDEMKVAKAIVKALDLPDRIGDLDPRTERRI